MDPSKVSEVIHINRLPVVVINLDERKDRWEMVSNDMHREGLTQFKRFSAIKPTDIIGSRPDFLPGQKQSYRIGCLGCLLSHYNVIKQAKADGLDSLLIFEDDAGFTRGNALEIAQNSLNQLYDSKTGDPGFDLLYLSGTHMKPCRPLPGKPNVVQVQKTFATNAYIVRSTLYDFLLERLPKVTKEIDVFYTEAVQTGGKFRCFCVKPHVTFQRPGYSDIQAKKVNYPMKNP